MSKKLQFQTVASLRGWIVREVGSSAVNSTHRSKAAAWGEARRLARGAGGEAFLTKPDGTSEVKNCYGVQGAGRKVREG